MNDRDFRRLVPAGAVAAAVVATAPVLGQLRDALLDAFGGRFLTAVAVLLGFAGVATLGVALLGIRDRHAERFGMLVAATALVGLQLWLWQTGDRRVDFVERIHLLEYGGLAVLFYRALGRPFVTLAVVGTVGVLDELVQWWSAIRTGDQRDVWLNLFAAVIGLLVAAALAPAADRPPGRRFFDRATLATGLGATAVFTACLAVLVEVAHLGHGAGDEEIRFRSFFSPARLATLAAERSATWAAEPPVLRAYAREDFFLTEAAWHVQERNRAWDAGDMTTAWVENRILERWYPPFLDLRSFRSGVVHRWPEAQRLAAETQRAHPLPGSSAAYWSPVLEGRVVIDRAARGVRGALGGAVLLSFAGWLWARRKGAVSFLPESRSSAPP